MKHGVERPARRFFSQTDQGGTGKAMGNVRDLEDKLVVLVEAGRTVVVEVLVD